jgi:tetratricopeptide (TPR) repeat protein
MDNEKKIKYLETRLKDNPKSILFAHLADIYLEKKRATEAVKLCQQGVKYNSDYVTGQFILAKAYLANENNEKAEEILKKVISHDRQFVAAHKLLADLMMKMGWENRAAIHYKEILRIDPLENDVRKTLKTISEEELESLHHEEISDEFKADEVISETIENTQSVEISEKEPSNEIEEKEFSDLDQIKDTTSDSLKTSKDVEWMDQIREVFPEEKTDKSSVTENTPISSDKIEEDVEKVKSDSDTEESGIPLSTDISEDTSLSKITDEQSKEEVSNEESDSDIEKSDLPFLADISEDTSLSKITDEQSKEEASNEESDSDIEKSDLPFSADISEDISLSKITDEQSKEEVSNEESDSDIEKNNLLFSTDISEDISSKKITSIQSEEDISDGKSDSIKKDGNLIFSSEISEDTSSKETTGQEDEPLFYVEEETQDGDKNKTEHLIREDIDQNPPLKETTSTSLYEKTEESVENISKPSTDNKEEDFSFDFPFEEIDESSEKTESEPAVIDTQTELEDLDFATLFGEESKEEKPVKKEDVVQEGVVGEKDVKSEQPVSKEEEAVIPEEIVSDKNEEVQPEEAATVEEEAVIPEEIVSDKSEEVQPEEAATVEEEVVTPEEIVNDKKDKVLQEETIKEEAIDQEKSAEPEVSTSQSNDIAEESDTDLSSIFNQTKPESKESSSEAPQPTEIETPVEKKVPESAPAIEKEEKSKSASSDTEKTPSVKKKIVTPTLAEIYIAQGQYAKAIEIYEHLQKENTEDTKFQEKIEELQNKLKEESEK